MNLIWSDKSERILPDTFIKTIFRIFTQFEPYTQQDAQEFLMVFLDKLDMELSQFKPDFKLMNLFRGSYKYLNRCQECSFASENVDFFTQLNISIPDEVIDPWLALQLSEEEQGFLAKAESGVWKMVKKAGGSKPAINLYHSLQGFVTRQTIEKFCSRCNSIQKHNTHIQIESLPDYLIISLKRFKYSFWSSKISDQVYLTKNLMFAKLQQTGEEYVLAAVIEHGGFVFRGHYKIYLHHAEEWWLLNDKKVRKSSFEEVFNAQAYIMMYVKKRVWEQLKNSNEEEAKKVSENQLDRNEEMIMTQRLTGWFSQLNIFRNK